MARFLNSSNPFLQTSSRLKKKSIRNCFHHGRVVILHLGGRGMRVGTIDFLLIDSESFHLNLPIPHVTESQPLILASSISKIHVQPTLPPYHQFSVTCVYTPPPPHKGRCLLRP